MRTSSPRRLVRVACAALVLLGISAPARPQGLPSEPYVLGGGRVTVSGDVTATFSCTGDGATGPCGQDTGFFNYSDYEHSTLRMLRADVSAAVRASRRVSFLAEVQSENAKRPHAYAFYVRIQPWVGRNFYIQAGRVPPTFGAFARRTYATDNPLIGYPLSYQYLTSLRPDAVPATPDELLRMRGRGWLSNFSIGNLAADRGVPLVTAFRWDTGVQVHAATSWAEATASVTTGSLANPLVSDDNGGKQVAGRVSVHPMAGLLFGASAARGPFLSNAVTRSAGVSSRAGDFVQSAFGADVEYSRAYYLVRMETVVSDWTLPAFISPLRAMSTSIEGRYKIHPRYYAAARFDHLGFSRITGTTRTAEWDAPVTRVEVGGGYLMRRNLQLKVSLQHNSRRGGRVPVLNFGAMQAVFWF